MPGKVTRSIRLKSGDIVQITVPVNATANQLREAIAQAASKVSTNLMGDLADIGYEGALEPQRANDTGFEKAKTPARFDQPVDRGFADPSRDYPSPSGSISATPDTLQSRAVGLGTSALSALGLGEKDAYRQASRYIDPAFEWTAAGSPDIAAEGVRDLVGGRYLDAAGNLGMAALDLVPGVGKGASALAMFLGPMAKNANIQMLEKAKLMADAGVDRDEIWKETGWFNQHGDWKFEISDLGLNVKKGILPKRGMGIKATAVLEHPELEANYPELKGGIFGNPLRVGGHVGGPKIAGAYYPDQHVVTFNTGRTKPQMVSTAAHELQHGLPQVTENFPIGSRVGEHPPIWAGPEVDEIQRQKDSFTGLLDTLPDEIWDDPAVRKQLKIYDDALDAEAAREGYRRSAGEVEARNVQERLRMEQSYKALGWSPEAIAKQMRDTPPWLTQDRADELQIVRRAEPIINDPRAAGAGPQLSEDLTAPLDLTGGTMQASEDLPKSALSGFEPSKAAMKTAKQLSTMAGSPAGPGKKATTRQVKKLSEDYLRQVDQGKEGADWYEQSGRSIMEHMGEDEAKAIKLAGAIGVTSARTPVLPNLEHGVRGHMQMMGGQPVVTGGFPTRMGGNIRDIYGQPDMTLDQLRGLGDEAFGPKVTPFIQQNLMYEGFEPGQPSTARAVHDIWDMRARGYTDKSGQPFTGTASTPQHRWTDLQDQGYLLPEANARAIGERTDWDTGRAQAAAWVGNKIDALMREGKTFAEAQKIAVTDYSHGWDRLYAQHSWESAPGSNTGHMAGFDDLPWEEKQRYHEDVKGAFLNPEGQSRIALGYGAPTGKSYDTTGLYEGVVNPGTQDLIAVAREPGKQTIDPGSRSVLDAVASTQGLLGAQKGAAWNYQSPTKSTIKGADAFRFDLGRTLSLEDIERLGPQIQQAYPSGNVGLLPDPSGLKLVKFWDEDADLPMGDFVKGLQKSEGLPKPFPTTQSGNYMENAWDAPEGRFGGQYVSTLKGLDIPDIGAKFDSFAPQIAQELVNNIDPKIMQAAGLTGSADMDRLRRTIAGEGWAGLNKLIDSQKGSVEAKAALLAAFAGLAGLGGMAATSEAQPQ